MKGTKINGIESKTVVEFLEVHVGSFVVILKLKNKSQKSPVVAVVSNVSHVFFFNKNKMH